MQVTAEELRDWTRDFYNVLMEPNGSSLLDLFSSTIAKQPNHHFQRVLMEVRDALMAGHSLSGAMSQHPDVFNATYITIIRYGEIYGEVDLTLQRFLERPEDMQPRCQVRPPQ
ncbi:MAG: type II secretion system F family protein [Abitibacteriaceae bacterium]|nr:type II secretion system F family protein [Abditibacteriaceae bacterium]MBV9863815.1 type II secretion system F family protein [Abditibacteriaceae bacterium]